MKSRRIKPSVLEDLRDKMVFVSGPRQCGKTTLADDVRELRAGTGLNWDVDQHQRLIRSTSLDEGVPLRIFDELHKFSR